MGMAPPPQQPPYPLPPIGIKHNDTLFKPGEIAPVSGQYQIVDKNGKPSSILLGGERTVVKGEPFPPTIMPGQKYRMVDKTITRSV